MKTKVLKTGIGWLVASIALVALLVGSFAYAKVGVRAENADASTAIIRQVYGGGGKGDTAISHSFIELYNPTSAPILLTGKSVQYMSNRGAKHAGDTAGLFVRFDFATNVSIAVGASFLLRAAQEATATSVITIADNKCDANWNRVIDNDASYYVALVSNTETILDFADADIIDKVSTKEPAIGVSKQKSIRKTNNNTTAEASTNWEVLTYNDNAAFIELLAANKQPHFSGGSVFSGATPPSAPTETEDSIPQTIFTDSLSLTKLAGSVVNPGHKDGGIAEIVKFNKANKKYYVVSGGTFNQLFICDISALTSSANTTLSGTKIDVAALATSDTFVFGDFTSLDISPNGEYLALSIQAQDFTQNGRVLILDKDGALVKILTVGVQPDMVTFSADGKLILTANEGEPKNGYLENSIAQTDPKGSVSIIDISSGVATAQVTTVDFTAFDTAEAQAKLVADGILLQNDILPSNDFEPEYIAINGAGTFAYVALQEANAIATLNLGTLAFTKIQSLGFIDHSKVALDAIKSSGKFINIQTLDNVFGVRMPDGITIYETAGETYILTANEGDAREWGSFSNIVKSKFGSDSLNPNLYANLDSKNTYMLGGRGFTIFKASDMSVVFDSGSDFETLTAQRLPEYFNVSNDKTEKDARSSKKGPEPENVTVGMVNGKMYAFIVLERIGGVVSYDISNLSKVTFAGYVNSRDFSGAFTSDAAPEGICFVNATDSPTGKPLVIVAFETSGTVAVYEATQIGNTTPPDSDATPTPPADSTKPTNPSLPDKGCKSEISATITIIFVLLGGMLPLFLLKRNKRRHNANQK